MTSGARVDAANLLDIALEAARAARDLVRAHARDGVFVAATKSTDVDIVTEADRAAERLIRSQIATARPDDAFLGEEGDDVAGSTGVRWVIDPIDGTVNFLYGIAAYAVSIAAECEGGVVAGVVLNVATGEEYTAHQDGEQIRACRQGQPIQVRASVPLGQRLLSTGFGYDAVLRTHQAEALVRLIPHIRDIRRLGSCALDLCAVAEGRLDGYFEEGVNLWDYAAGALIARGAGASVEVTTGVGGGTLVLAAPRAGFTETRDAIARAGFLKRET
ncbi:inositol monophosphatase family protein [Nocardioides sp.]|uniref:inositol monophosphatase family protein n=1 Tax=Nocardioides sp. TaxID=35761 RepID=UPI003564B950